MLDKTPLEKRHFASGLNSKFNSDHPSFTKYILATREMIRKVRSVTTPADLLNKAVDGNSPFELDPAGSDTAGRVKRWRRGILLIHGLSDSPYCMRHLAAIFQENGFRVMAVLLPGHGTRPGDLLDVSWQEWARAVAFASEKLAAEVDGVYLGGFSAGGTLSIYQSTLDNNVRGIFLFAPALEISPWAAFAWLHRLVSWISPTAKWLKINPDRDVFKYESFTKNSVEQMHKLTKALKNKKLEELEIPVFCLASVDDGTVSTPAIIEFMARLPNLLNKLILYTTDREKFTQNSSSGRTEWLNSVVPEQKILSSAHTSILISPDDEHYGEDADYANCIHYYPGEMKKYHACISNPEICWQGEISEDNLKMGLLRRLMYNPKYSELKVSLSQFIGKLP